MNRRTLVRRAAVAGALGVAGCSGSGRDGAATDASPTDGTRQTDTSTTTTDERTETDRKTIGEGTDVPTTLDGATVTDRSFSVLDRSCGNADADAATVAFSESGVTVEGTVVGSDTCTSARLDALSYDEDAKRLTVDVEPFRDVDGETVACGQCIVEIDYRLELTFATAVPDEVRVRHDGTVVTTGHQPER